MNSSDAKTLIDRIASGEASGEEIRLLGQLAHGDGGLAGQLREELEFSELIRQALEPAKHAGQSEGLRDLLDHQSLRAEEWINLARDGELTPALGDELARRVLDSPEFAEQLRAALFEDEWFAQAVSDQKSEEAFVESLATRMWAETEEDQFVKDLTRKLDGMEKSVPENVVPFSKSAATAPKTRSRHGNRKSLWTAAAAALIAWAAVAFSVHFSTRKSPVLVQIAKSTGDAEWAEGYRPGRDGDLRQGLYRLISGAVSLSLPGGKTLAVQGPAFFEVAGNGEAILHRGVALAATTKLPQPGEVKFGVGLSAKNIQFSEGAITVGLDARSSESIEAVVFSGEAGICLTDKGNCRNVFEHEAVKAHHATDRFVDVPYNPRAFSKAWELVAGVEKNMGDIVIAPPGTRRNARPAKSGEIHVFVEKDFFRPEAPLEVDVLKPGYFASGEAESKGRSIGAVEGEAMRSYLVELGPSPAGSHGKDEVEASLTFDHPVVGVIFSSDRLWQSDEALGVGVTDHIADASKRGLDNLDDKILLSEDGRTLNLRLKGSDRDVDQVRVLVALR